MKYGLLPPENFLGEQLFRLNIVGANREQVPAATENLAKDTSQFPAIIYTSEYTKKLPTQETNTFKKLEKLPFIQSLMLAVCEKLPGQISNLTVQKNGDLEIRFKEESLLKNFIQPGTIK